MAILISKQKAQSKGAMTTKPFANSTFTEGLFLLEDAMTKTNARIKSRKIYEKYYNVKLPSNIVIHHKDGNPFNFEISNLEQQTYLEHNRYHRSLKSWNRWSNSYDLFERVEIEISIFNHNLKK